MNNMKRWFEFSLLPIFFCFTVSLSTCGVGDSVLVCGRMLRVLCTFTSHRNLRKILSLGAESSVVKSIICSLKRPGFSSQHPQLDLVPSSGLCGHCVHWHTLHALIHINSKLIRKVIYVFRAYIFHRGSLLYGRNTFPPVLDLTIALLVI